LSIFIPFSYILLGIILGRFSTKFSKYASFILINILIPIVVMTTIITYEGTIFGIIIASYLFSVFMYYISKKIFDSLILQISFSYYNIGWLGLPIAIYFFGIEVSALIIAAYIGGMLFGSTFCIYMLNAVSKNKSISPLKKLLYSPPFIAFAIASVIKFTIGTIALNEEFSTYYIYIKTIMSIFGMAILGMWLQNSAIKKDTWSTYLRFSIIRLLVGITLYSTCFGFLYYINLISNMEFFYLFIIPLLPVAANIVVLETYYLKQSYSAQVIAINTIFSLIVLVIYGIIVQKLI